MKMMIPIMICALSSFAQESLEPTASEFVEAVEVQTQASYQMAFRIKEGLTAEKFLKDTSTEGLTPEEVQSIEDAIATIRTIRKNIVSTSKIMPVEDALAQVYGRVLSEKENEHGVLVMKAQEDGVVTEKEQTEIDAAEDAVDTARAKESKVQIKDGGGTGGGKVETTPVGLK